MLRLGAVADVHARPGTEPALTAMFAAAQDQVDILIIAGDLTDTGFTEEAVVLGRVLSALDVPVVAVLGNHDFHHDQAAGIRAALEEHGVTILDGEGVVIEQNGVRLGIGGCVGFGGGFRPFSASPFGEPEWKYLYAKIVEESRKLDRGLSAVHGADYVVAVTHYSPTIDTMGDEPEALHPYLGSSELGDALDRHKPMFAVHGHAHRGRLEGCTAEGVPVFNVAMTIVEQPLVWRFDHPGDDERPREPVLIGQPNAAGAASQD